MKTIPPRNISAIAPELRYFLEVARTLNLTLAADALGLGQPAMSKAIRKLEGQLGLTLLTRQSRGVALTRAGETLRANLKEWSGAWTEIQSSLLQQQSRLAGEFSLGCHSSIGTDCLAPIMKELLEKHPEIRWRLVQQSSRATTEDVFQLRLDFGLVIDPFPFPDLAIVRLADRRIGTWQARSPTAMNRLSSPEAVLFFNPEMVSIAEFVTKLRKSGAEFKQTVPVNDYEVISSLTAAGCGLAVLPETIAGRFRLTRAVLPDGRPTPVGRVSLCLIYRPDRQKSAASRAIVSVIRSKKTGGRTKAKPEFPGS